jgi:hypothetical protein
MVLGVFRVSAAITLSGFAPPSPGKGNHLQPAPPPSAPVSGQDRLPRDDLLTCLRTLPRDLPLPHLRWYRVGTFRTPPRER